MRKSLCLVLLMGAVFAFLTATGAQAQTCAASLPALEPAADVTLEEIILTADPAAGTAVEAQTCTFCNVSGYPVCQNLDGTSCSAPGTSRRCIVSPVCACEWGVCRCGTTGTWNCFW